MHGRAGRIRNSETTALWIYAKEWRLISMASTTGQPRPRQFIGILLSWVFHVLREVVLLRETRAHSMSVQGNNFGGFIPYRGPENLAMKPGRQPPGRTRARPIIGAERVWMKSAGWCSSGPARPLPISMAATAQGTIFSPIVSFALMPGPDSVFGISKHFVMISGIMI